MNTSLYGSIPFIQGVPSRKPEPLSRYLPAIPDGVVSAWLNKNSPPGSWILDPFGASPKVALDAARSGYRILVTANNPITRFLMELMADPPTSEELKSAIAELSASYIGDQRIEPHIRSLYNTTCARCGQTLSAEYFIWEHGNPSPSIRSYTCQNCGDSGEHPCTAQDIELACQFSSSGPHRARALERVLSATDPDRVHLEQALSVYIPRALYALITILNKIEGLNISPLGHKHLSALLLYTFDQANAMWRVANLKERRRQLSITRHFRENNVWLALEEGINLWAADPTPISISAIPVTTWPDFPPLAGGICIFEGRLVSLVDSLKDIRIHSVCTAIPRPNQAFWTLSALWSGWLWGREAVGKFKSVLHRQRYDWSWHTTALSSVFKQLTAILEPTSKILGLIGEAEPGFIGSTLTAADITGFQLESIAIRPEEERAQLIWRFNNPHPVFPEVSSIAQAGVYSARRYLELKGEPDTYLTTISAAFMGIIRSWSNLSGESADEPGDPVEPSTRTNEIAEQPEASASITYSNMYNSAREALSYRSGFLRYNPQDLSNLEQSAKNQLAQSSLFSLDLDINTEDEGASEIPEIPAVGNEPVIEKEKPIRSSDISMSTLIWLRDTQGIDQVPLTDRFELTQLTYLRNNPGSTLNDIDKAMCEAYPGLFTPPLEFIRLCLESYGYQSTPASDQWFLRPEDDLVERQSDLDQAVQILHQIGERLKYLCADRASNFEKSSVLWFEKNSEPAYWFFPSITAAIGQSVLNCEQPPVRGFIVVPGSRANLLVYRLRHDPRLAKAFNLTQGNWRFLKFRHLRSLAGSPNLNRDNLEHLLSLDPITYSTPQLWLI